MNNEICATCGKLVKNNTNSAIIESLRQSYDCRMKEAIATRNPTYQYFYYLDQN